MIEACQPSSTANFPEIQMFDFRWDESEDVDYESTPIPPNGAEVDHPWGDVDLFIILHNWPYLPLY